MGIRRSFAASVLVVEGSEEAVSLAKARVSAEVVGAGCRKASVVRASM